MFFLRFRDMRGIFRLTFVPHHLGHVLRLSQQSPDVSPLYGA